MDQGHHPALERPAPGSRAEFPSLTSIPSVCRAQDFSADVIYVQPTKVPPTSAQATSAQSAGVQATAKTAAKAAAAAKAGVKAAPSKSAAAEPPPLHSPSRLYVSKDKIRLETMGITGTILIVNSADNSTIALFPANKAFQPLASAPAEYFHVDDAENACPDWQKVSERKIDCEKVGHELVDGRQTVKYLNKAATPAAPLAAIWIDPALNFVAKWEDSSTAAELRNITKQEKLSTALFEVPPGFELLKPKKKGQKAPAK